MAALLRGVLLALLGALARGARAAGARAAGGLPWRPPPQPLGLALPVDLAWHVLGLVPLPRRIVWSAGRRAAGLLRLDGGAPRMLLRGHAGGSKEATFFPKGDKVLTLGFEGVGIVWDVRSGRALHQLRHGREHLARILDARIFPGGDRVVTLGSGGDAIVWSAATGEVLSRITLLGIGVHWVVRVPPSGKEIVTAISGMWGDPAVVWELATSRPRHFLTQPRDTMRLLEMSPCGARLATAGFHLVFLWSIAEGRLEQQLRAALDWNSRLALSWGGAHVFASTTRSMQIWCGETGRLHRRIAVGGAFSHFALLSRGERVVAFAPCGAAGVWDVRSGELLQALPGALGNCSQAMDPGDVGVVRIVTSPHGDLAAACGLYWPPSPASAAAVEWATVWGASTGRVLYMARGPSDENEMFCSIAIAPAQTMAEAVLY